MQPNLVCPGAQKSASTFLSNWLGAHPQVFTRRGEYRGFEDPEFERDGLSDLELDLPPETVVYGIRRPDYLTDPAAAGRIHRRLPDARILVVLRDPVDRAVSGYHHYVAYGLLPPRPADESLRRIFAVGPDRDAGLAPAAVKVRVNGEYAPNLERFRQQFGPERVRILLAEDLAGDTGLETYASLCEFLEIEPLAVERPPGRPQVTIGSIPALRARSAGNRYRYDVDHEHAKSYSRDKAKLPFHQKAVVQATGWLQHQVAQRSRAGTYVVSPETRELMYRHYEPTIDQLEVMLGRDLSGWRPTRPATT